MLLLHFHFRRAENCKDQKSKPKSTRKKWKTIAKTMLSEGLSLKLILDSETRSAALLSTTFKGRRIHLKEKRDKIRGKQLQKPIQTLDFMLTCITGPLSAVFIKGKRTGRKCSES